MFSPKPVVARSKIELYAELHVQARALLKGERDPIANAANIAALVFHTLPDLNWAGFYWRKGDELVLGPFQGQPACDVYVTPTSTAFDRDRVNIVP